MYFTRILNLILGFGLLILTAACGPGFLTLSADSVQPDNIEQPTGVVVDSTSLNGKMIMGYQGWFGAKGDGSQRNRWDHWTPAEATGVRADNLVIDYWPDLSEYGADELYPTDMFLPNGQRAYLFSSYNRKTVMRHVKWMRDYNIDGVTVGRFAAGLGDAGYIDFNTKMLSHIRDGASSYGRVFLVAYDLTNTDPNTVVDNVINDWKRLVDQGVVTDRYQKHRGKPVLMIWGLGTAVAPQYDQALRLLNFFQRDGATRYQATLLGGVPADWRSLTTLNGDARWVALIKRFEIISPWVINGFNDSASMQNYVRDNLVPDVAEARRLGIEYMPTAWPGFSAFNRDNLSSGGTGAGSRLDHVTRNGGRFWWEQMYHFKQSGVNMVLGAMFDEVDEGTAMFKMVATRDKLPREAANQLLYTSYNGENLPSDWYLRVAGQSSRMLKGEVPATLQMRIP